MSMTATPERKKEGRRTVFPMHRLKLEQPRDDGKRRIEGYAAVFGNRDSYGDIILPGAFARTLRERPEVKVLWQHDRERPIGKQETGFEDEFGLAVTGVLTNTDFVKGEVVPLLQDEVVTGLSIGYNVVVEEYNEDAGAWFLKDIELFEWSPVTFPANELAQVSEVKDLGDRTDGQVVRVERHAKALLHLLAGDGYFAKSSDRRDALPSDLLGQLVSALGSKSQSDDHGDAADASTGPLEYLKGWNDALDHLEQEGVISR